MCNEVYFSWAAAIKFNFPSDMRRPIFLVMFGRLNQLLDIIVAKAKNLYMKASNRSGRVKNEASTTGDNKDNVVLNVEVVSSSDYGANVRNFPYEKPQSQQK